MLRLLIVFLSFGINIFTEIKTIYVDIGKRQNLSCTFDGVLSDSDVHSLKWFYNHTKPIVYVNAESYVILNPNYKLRAEMSGNRDLILYNIKSSDSGLYTCVIGKKNDRIIQAIYLLLSNNKTNNSSDKNIFSKLNWNYFTSKILNEMNIQYHIQVFKEKDNMTVNLQLNNFINVHGFILLMGKQNLLNQKHIDKEFNFGNFNNFQEVSNQIIYPKQDIFQVNVSHIHNSTQFNEIFYYKFILMSNDNITFKNNFENSILPQNSQNFTIFINAFETYNRYKFNLYILESNGETHFVKAFSYLSDIKAPKHPPFINDVTLVKANSVNPGGTEIYHGPLSTITLKSNRDFNGSNSIDNKNYSIILTWFNPLEEDTTERHFLNNYTFYNFEFYTVDHVGSSFFEKTNVTFLFPSNSKRIRLIDAFNLTKNDILRRQVNNLQNAHRDTEKHQIIVGNLKQNTPYYVRIAQTMRSLIDPDKFITGNFSAFKRFIMLSPKSSEIVPQRSPIQMSSLMNGLGKILFPNHVNRSLAYGGYHASKGSLSEGGHFSLLPSTTGNVDNSIDNTLGIVTGITLSIIFGALALFMLFTWKRYHNKQKYSFLPPPSPTNPADDRTTAPFNESNCIPSTDSKDMGDGTRPVSHESILNGLPEGVSYPTTNCNLMGQKQPFYANGNGVKGPTEASSSVITLDPVPPPINFKGGGSGVTSAPWKFSTLLLPKFLLPLPSKNNILNHKRNSRHDLPFHSTQLPTTKTQSSSLVRSGCQMIHSTHDRFFSSPTTGSPMDSLAENDTVSSSLEEDSSSPVAFSAPSSKVVFITAAANDIFKSIRSWWSKISGADTSHGSNQSTKDALLDETIVVINQSNSSSDGDMCPKSSLTPDDNNSHLPQAYFDKADPYSSEIINPICDPNISRSTTTTAALVAVTKRGKRRRKSKLLPSGSLISRIRDTLTYASSNASSNKEPKNLLALSPSSQYPRPLSSEPSRPKRSSSSKRSSLNSGSHHSRAEKSVNENFPPTGGSYNNSAFEMGPTSRPLDYTNGQTLNNSGTMMITSSVTNQWLTAIANSDYSDFCRQIPITRFRQYVRLMHTNTDQGFSDQFMSIVNFNRCLEVGGPSTFYDTSASSYPQSLLTFANRAKNRYANIFAYPHTRAPLDQEKTKKIMTGMPVENVNSDSNISLDTSNSLDDSDYINANFIEGYGGNKLAYIATQGPLPNTISDFWKLVWNYEIDTIIMITNLVEKGKVKCDKYWPNEADEQRYGDYQVHHLTTEKRAFFTVRTFAMTKQQLFDESSNESKKGSKTNEGIVRGNFNSETHVTATANKVLVLSGVPKTKKWRHRYRQNENNTDHTEEKVDDKPPSSSVPNTHVNHSSSQSKSFDDNNIIPPLSSPSTPPSCTYNFNQTTFNLNDVNHLLDQPDSSSENTATGNNDSPVSELTEALSVPVKLRQQHDTSKNHYSATDDEFNKMAPRAFFNKSSARDSTASYVISSSNSIVTFDSAAPALLTIPHPQNSEKHLEEHAFDRKTPSPSLLDKLPSSPNSNYNQRVHLVKQYHYTEWPDHGVPHFTLPLLNFIRTCGHAESQSAATPNTNRRKTLLVHCSAGVGRTGTFFVIDAMLEKIKNAESLNIYEYLSTIRTQRNYLVQTEEQYIFIHDALNRAIQLGDTQTNFRDVQMLLSSAHSHENINNSTTLPSDSPNNCCYEDKLKVQTEALLEFNCDFSYLLSRDRGNHYLQNDLAPYDFNSRNKYPYLSGLHECNLLKNKMYLYATKKNYNNCTSLLLPRMIVPNDTWRVYLTPKPALQGSDYINASYLEGYFSQKDYILTQHPTIETIQSFWRMVWENNVANIFLLINPTPNSATAFHTKSNHLIPKNEAITENISGFEFVPGSTTNINTEDNNNLSSNKCHTINHPEPPFEIPNNLPFWPTVGKHLNFEGIKVYCLSGNNSFCSGTLNNPSSLSNNNTIQQMFEDSEGVENPATATAQFNVVPQSELSRFTTTLAFSLESEDEDYQLLTKMHICNTGNLPDWFATSLPHVLDQEGCCDIQNPIINRELELNLYKLVKSMAQKSAQAYNLNIDFTKPPPQLNNNHNQSDNIESNCVTPTTNQKKPRKSVSKNDNDVFDRSTSSNTCAAPPIIVVDNFGGSEGGLLCVLTSCLIEYVKLSFPTNAANPQGTEENKIDIYQYAYDYNIKRINLFTGMEDLLKMYTGMERIISFYKNGE